MIERFKDINECLCAGVSQADIRGCFDGARDFAPKKVRRVMEYEDEFLQAWFDQVLEQGLELPFGFPWRVRSGETTVWTGIEKSGKTTMLSFILMNLLKQGERALVAAFEVRPVKTLKKYSRQAFGALIFDHKEENKLSRPEDKLAYRASSKVNALDTLRWLDKGLWVYDHTGIAHWRDVLEDFRWARRRHGITQFVLDNFMRLGVAKDDYAQQADCMMAIAALAMDLNVHIHVVVHQNKAEGQKGFSGKRSVSGAFEIIANAHNIVEVQRDETKGKAVSELWQKKDLNQIPDAEFDEGIKKWDATPDGKFILHAQRDGEEQNGSRYLYFLWKSQQYVSWPKTDSRSHATNFVKDAKNRELKDNNDLPSSDDMGLAEFAKIVPFNPVLSP
jgi:twinkle protein